MSASADKRLEAAIEEVLSKGPADILTLLQKVRGRGVPGFLRQEGMLHAVLHRGLRRGDWQVVGRTHRGLAAYATARFDGSPPMHEPLEPKPIDPKISQHALKIARSVRDEAEQGRVVSDTVAHLEALGDEDKRFGNVGTIAAGVHRADRGRLFVAVVDGPLTWIKRFVFHEGPWIAAAVIGFFLIQAFAFQVFQIPSESMRPSLLMEDRVIVSKFGGGELPDRWKIVTFKQGDRVIVKRAIAFGGETIAIHRGDVLIDGRVSAKPDDLRALLRFPRESWSFQSNDHKDWVREERRGATHLDLRREVLDTLFADRWYSNGPPATRTRSVYVHDGYLRLDADRPADGRVALVMQRGPARRRGVRGSASDQRTRFVLVADASGVRLEEQGGGEASRVLAEAGALPAGPLRLEISYVDGILRASAGDLRFEGPVSAPRLPLVPSVVFTGAARIRELSLDQDIHYGYGRKGSLLDPAHGVPANALDDDPSEWAFSVPEDHFFVLGDNPGNSTDSRGRAVGAIPRATIVGPVIFRIWPPSRLGTPR